MTIKVGFDYDEPVFPWYDYAHKVSVEAGLTSPDAEPPTRWDPHSHYGCTLEEWVAVLDAEVDKGVHGMYGWPVKHTAADAIRKLYSMGYEVHIITARGQFGEKGETIKRLTRSQLLREKIPYTSLHFSREKHIEAEEIGLDYFIDDRPDYVEAVREVGVEAYLLDERWNQDHETDFRVYSTSEYVERILGRHGNQSVLTVEQRDHVRGYPAPWQHRSSTTA